MVNLHAPTPLFVSEIVNHGEDYFFPICYWHEHEVLGKRACIVALVPVTNPSDEKYRERAEFIVKAVNYFDELVTTLLASKIPHYVCEDDPNFSCHASQSSIDYYNDPQIMRRPYPICSCGADAHNERIDDLITKVRP